MNVVIYCRVSTEDQEREGSNAFGVIARMERHR